MERYTSTITRDRPVSPPGDASRFLAYSKLSLPLVSGERMSSNNTTNNCYGLPDRQYKIFLIIDKTTKIVQATLFGLSIVLLLIFLRKKAFNNPAKRFGLSLIVAFSLISFTNVAIELYPSTRLPRWLCVLTMALYSLGSTVILYLVALPVALLQQVSESIFTQNSCLHRISPRRPVIEASFQLTIVTASVLINGLQFIDSEKSEQFCKKCVIHFYYEPYALSVSVVAMTVTIVVLGLLYCKFRSAIVLTRKTRQVMVKIFFLFLVANAGFIGDSIVSASIKKYKFELSIAQSIYFTAVKLVFVPAMLVLIYSPNTSCTSKCCCPTVKKETAPLLPQQSEESHTNPQSVWDHANDPSYTPSYHPLEMSDCNV